MGLEIRHNRAEHTHENEQFRRVATSLNLLFDQKGWQGLLIGNPFNDDYSRFRADAILLYDHGLVIIDFKDYSGTIKLPSKEDEFQSIKWYTESDADKNRIEIKAGARFVNPFRQLKSYREAMFEIIRNNIVLNDSINPSRVCMANIFTGPIVLNNSIPRALPYYKIVQESDLATFLYDFSSENSYSEESAAALKSIFHASVWEEQIELKTTSKPLERVIRVDKDVSTELSAFLQEKSSGILVLESMHAHERDDWMKYILSESVEYDIPQTEVWTHSARIGRKLSSRTGIAIQSLYNTIYGGSASSAIEDKGDEIDEDNEEQLQELVPIRSDEMIDSSAVIILHEAHLVTRSLHQSDLLRFGSGRLLEDLLNFLSLDKNNRKLICIGDPYSLTYGKDEDSSLHLETLQELYNGNIKHFRQHIKPTDRGGKASFRTDLGLSIEGKIFNHLTYPWKDSDLVYVNKNQIGKMLKEWFDQPATNEPDKCVLVYSNKDARKINNWVKTNCLRNGSELSTNDLLIINNNINIPDETGFGQPTRLYNGMFLLVKERLETISHPIRINQSKTPILLSFTKLNVVCLSIPNKLETEVWLLDNYFLSDDQLSKNEQIAFRVFVNQLVQEEIAKNPFAKSFEYSQLKQDKAFIDLDPSEKDAIEQLINNIKVSTTAKARSILSKYRKKHRKKALSQVAAENLLVNAALASYGWALTVHKSIGSNFVDIIFNAYQGEGKGLTNASYYRWLYSAITAANSISYVANPQELNSLMDCQFEDIPNVVTDDNISNDQIPLSYPGYKVKDAYKNIIDTSLNENIVGAICELSDLLKNYNYILHSVIKSGDYLTKIHFTITGGGKRLVIACNNNRLGQVSSIRVEKSDGVNTEPVNEAIQQLFLKSKPNVVPDGLALPSDFRLDVYSKWSNVLKDDGLTLLLKETHSFQDVFEARCEKRLVKFRVYYNGKGFFTKVTVLQKSDSQLGQYLQNLLLN
jgi:hypothetical protein